MVLLVCSCCTSFLADKVSYLIVSTQKICYLFSVSCDVHLESYCLLYKTLVFDVFYYIIMNILFKHSVLQINVCSKMNIWRREIFFLMKITFFFWRFGKLRNKNLRYWIWKKTFLLSKKSSFSSSSRNSFRTVTKEEEFNLSRYFKFAVTFRVNWKCIIF